MTLSIIRHCILSATIGLLFSCFPTRVGVILAFDLVIIEIMCFPDLCWGDPEKACRC